jgi:opacity protein-like surface antigen
MQLSIGIAMASAMVGALSVCASAAAEEKTAATAEGTYVSFDVGATFISSIDILPFTPSDPTSFGNSLISADVENGIGLNIALGFELTESFALEFETGYYSNDFGGFTSGQFTSIFGTTDVVGGSGDFHQIPLFINGSFDIPLRERAAGADAGEVTLDLMFGLGVVNVGADITDIQAAGIPGISAGIDGNSWEFGGQLGVGLAWEISSGVSIGLGYRLMAVSGADFGIATFSDPSLVGIDNVEADNFLTHSVQANFSYEF